MEKNFDIKKANGGVYLVIRNNVFESVIASTVAETHAQQIVDALNYVEASPKRDKWIAVNAMSLMHRLQYHAGDEIVQLMRDAVGDEGFLEGVIEVAPLAIKATDVELALFHSCEEKGFPGVYQYEVTEELGAALAGDLKGTSDCLIDVCLQKLGDLALDFIVQGEDDPVEKAKYAAIIRGVLPDWKQSNEAPAEDQVS